MGTQKERDDEQPGDVHFHREIDPATGFAHHTTILPAGPVVPEPSRSTFLQRHPYLGPIIGSIIAVIGAAVFFLLGKK